MSKLLVTVAAVAAAFIHVPSARAQIYPWCANYSDMDGGGGSNCGFTTREQCLATISGIGGYCDLNAFYRRGTERRAVKRLRKRPVG